MGTERTTSATAIHSDTQLTLNPDALGLVFRHLSIKDIFAARDVCRAWKAIASSPGLVKFHVLSVLGQNVAYLNSISEENYIDPAHCLMLYRNIWHGQFSTSYKEYSVDLVFYKMAKVHGLDIIRNCLIGGRNDLDNNTLLSLAFENADLAAAQKHVLEGADVRIFNGLHFKSALPYKEQKGFIKLLLALKHFGADITFTDKQYILDEAMEARDVAIAEAMIDLGAEARVFDELALDPPGYGGGYSVLEVFSPTPDDPLNLALEVQCQALQVVEIMG